MVTKRPNILFIVIDCLRADRAFGSQRTAQAPTLQKLADHGTLFSHLITVNSVTIPCMTSVFCGMYPNSHGVRVIANSRVGDDTPLLAEILQENGFHTYAETTQPLDPWYRLDRGFSSYNARNGVKSSFLDAWGDEFINRFRTGQFKAPWFVYLHLWELHQPRQIQPKYDAPEYGRTIYDRAISTLDARLGQLLVNVDDQTIVIVTGDHGEKIPEVKLETQIEQIKRLVSRAISGNSKGAKRLRHLKEFIRKSWYSSIRSLHHAGLVESPLATVTGHGYHVYDSLVRVPLVIKGYSHTITGQIINTPIRQIDIMPTILSMVGLDSHIPKNVEGRDVTPLIHGQSLPSLPIFIESCQDTRKPSDLYGVRTNTWKYAGKVIDPSFPEELYNLLNDPAETTNLAKIYAEKTAELRTLLQQHLQHKTDPSIQLSQELKQEELIEIANRLEDLGYIE